MRWPPRRSPSERPGALAGLYELLYPQGRHAIALDEAYRSAREHGVALTHVWVNRGACPHAVESTATLIQAQQLDEKLLGRSRSAIDGGNAGSRAAVSAAAAAWPVRSAYSMAMIRFVNAVADEQQKGLYAQSIFSIAERIGLPIWFVELRHAATHEELPSLEVLRQASVDALGWLQSHFWQPTVDWTISHALLRAGHFQDEHLTESIPADEEKSERILSEGAAAIRTHLKAYKRLAKQVARDASLRGQTKVDINASQARTLGVARQTAKALAAAGGNGGSFAVHGGDAREASALLAEVLVEPGFLVPDSKLKRSRPGKGENIATLPEMLAKTWLPLLTYLSESLLDFGTSLQEAILDRVQGSSTGVQARSTSYLHTLASWLIYIYGGTRAVISTQRARTDYGYGARSYDNDESEEMDIHGSAQHLTRTDLGRSCLAAPTPISLAIVRQLCAQDALAAERLEPLLDLAKPLDTHSDIHAQHALHIADGGAPVPTPNLDQAETGVDEMERAVLAMEEKLAALSKASSKMPHDLPRTAHVSSSPAGPSKQELLDRISERRKRQEALCAQLPGWTVGDSSASSFRSTPLGCLDGTVPDLVLRI